MRFFVEMLNVIIDRYFYMHMKIPKHFHRLNFKFIFRQLNDAKRRCIKIYLFFSIILYRFNEKMSKYRIETATPEAKPEFDVNNQIFFFS
jgi:hypothetical protein